MNLKIKKEYSITFRKFLFNKRFSIKTLLLEPYNVSDNESKEELIRKFEMFGLKVYDIIDYHSLMLEAPSYIDVCDVETYEVLQNNNQKTNIMEIIDLTINKKYRGKGIGSQILSILKEIALDNGFDCIIGELKGDKINKPLETRLKDRKEFFTKNGFSILYNKESKFSGCLIKKSFLKK